MTMLRPLLPAAAILCGLSGSGHAALLFDQYGTEIDNGVIASGSNTFINSWSPAAADDFQIGATGEQFSLEQVSFRLGKGSMNALLEEREELRAKIGQTTFLTARKPA